MTDRRDLLGDSFAAFIDENATGIGLPPSERRSRIKPLPFSQLQKASLAVAASFGEFGRQVQAAVESMAAAIVRGLKRPPS